MSMDDPVKREELLSELDGCLLERDKQVRSQLCPFSGSFLAFDRS